jgi:hypothetical protein
MRGNQATKKREARSLALYEPRHCPSLSPTRLAVGLELEVFVVQTSKDTDDSPRFRSVEHWFPRVACAVERHASSADIQLSIIAMLLSSRVWINHQIPGPYLLTTHVHDWSLIRILFCLSQNLVRHWSSVALPKCNVLQQV